MFPILHSPPSIGFNCFAVEDDKAKKHEEREGWETIMMDGQTLGICTSEKCQAFETLVIYCSTLGGVFAPYFPQSLKVALPSLQFYFHEGVPEACAMYVHPLSPRHVGLSAIFAPGSSLGFLCAGKPVAC
jgi:importin-5